MSDELDALRRRVASLETHRRTLTRVGILLFAIATLGVPLLRWLASPPPGFPVASLATHGMALYGDGFDVGCVMVPDLKGVPNMVSDERAFRPCFVVSRDMATGPFLVFSASEDGQPRLDLFDGEKRSVWHAP